ncbi:protein NLP1-like [Bidens hawaiensis]|uniref:protein NLP1-like n=1 Tax=Bidens hawaiensis TaxID=980011 RepID=UPI00404983AF
MAPFMVFAGEPFRLSTIINYIGVLTTEEVKKKIISVIATHLNSRSPSVLVQYWAAKKIGNIYVLTTTCQPFGVSGDNKELQTYRKACLDHKIYVCKEPEKEVAFGLPGRVFLNCTPEQTQNVHRYPPDHRPPCEEAIFNKIWGSFAMPVIEADTCVGVLEFVMDTPNVSYTNDILDVYSALVHAGLKSSSIQLDRPRMTNINSRKRLRKTKSFSVTKYCCLVPYFGLSSAHAAEKLGLKTGAFRDLQRNVGIPEWPWIRHTAARDSSVPEAQINQAVAESTNEIAFQTSDTEARIESELSR